MIEQIQIFLQAEQSAILVFGVTLLGFYALKRFFLARLHLVALNTKTGIDDLAILLIKSIRWPFALVLAFIIATFFTSATLIQDTPFLDVLIIFVVTYQVGQFIDVLFRWTQREMVEAGTHLMSGFKTILIIVVWVLGLVTMISALGYDVTSLVAGLGIGGLAVALALQNILGDVFSSASIFFDKPFAVGDYIQVGDKDGVVEQVGLKTTRLRSLRGELIIIANKNITDSIVQNFGALERRRIVIELSFEYSTSNEKLDQMRADVTDMIKNKSDLTFDRFYFKSFGDSALIFELVFYVESGEYTTYVDAQHDLNLMIKKYVEDRKINMAFPTRTLYMKQS